MIKNLFYLFNLLLVTTPAFAMNTFTIYTFKSPIGVNWKSPKALAASVVKNEAVGYVSGNKRLLGHVSIDLKCQNRQIITAMTSRDGENRNMVLKQHSGLGVLLHIFPGELEPPEKLLPEIASKRRKGSVHSITYLISDAACEQMLDHYDNFVAKGGNHNYGFPVDTLAGEGGGCSAFGVSFLQAANLATAEQLTAWSGSVWIPEKFVGPYNSERYTSGDQEVLPNTQGGTDVKLVPMLLKPKKTKWAEPNEAGASYLEFFDPDTMFQWVETMAKAWTPESDYQKRTFNKSIDLVFDYRQR